jgi:hypothetical protein
MPDEVSQVHWVLQASASYIPNFTDDVSSLISSLVSFYHE